MRSFPGDAAPTQLSVDFLVVLTSQKINGELGWCCSVPGSNHVWYDRKSCSAYFTSTDKCINVPKQVVHTLTTLQGLLLLLPLCLLPSQPAKRRVEKIKLSGNLPCTLQFSCPVLCLQTISLSGWVALMGITAMGGLILFGIVTAYRRFRGLSDRDYSLVVKQQHPPQGQK